MKLCWNAIVRNEAARIERCMESVIHHVDCAVILDTGSTDDTPERIVNFFAAHGKVAEVHRHAFVNFEDARNRALRRARRSQLAWDYLLLMDADMELAVQRAIPELTGAAYNAQQRAGSLVYANTRFLSCKSKAKYVGVTHEYLDVPEGFGAVSADDLFFIDHADGANRTDKFTRDIALLKAALKQEPGNARYWFYLGQSYRDAGQPVEALRAYQKRVELGGWDEEVWNAQLNVAHAMLGCGSEEGFVANLLQAHEMRPRRAEAIYDLAKHYREKGRNKLAATFAKIAMDTKQPDDLLFVNKYVYEVGAKEEYAIAAFYDEATRAEGFRACDSVALGAHGYGASTHLARANLFHYLPRADEVMPSFWSTEVRSEQFPSGWALLNPSVALHGKDIYGIVRSVNYVIGEDGSYSIAGKGSAITADNPVRTRNFIVKFNDTLGVEKVKPIYTPRSDLFPLVLGWEDMRLFHCGGALLTSATVREANAQGRCEQWVGKLADWGDSCRVEEARCMPSHQEHEKNWMPVINGGLKFIYKLGQVISSGGTITQRDCDVNIEHLRGSSQVIPFRSGYLAIVHEASYAPGGGYAQRYYWHRFVFFDVDLNVMKVSMPFVFHDKQIEFCAGLCKHPDGRRLIISFGVRDKAAHLAMVDANDAAEFIFR